MGKSNLGQYAKVGLGLDFLVEGALGVYEKVSQDTAMAQEVFQRAERIGLETIQKANDLAHNFAIGKNIDETLITSGLIIGGGMLLASGVYNLAKEYKSPIEE